MTSSQYANHICFRHNQSLRVKQKEMESSGTQIGVNAVNASLWLLIRKACVVRTLTKFLENYLKRKKCITKSSGFRMICLEKPVLHALLSTLNHSRGGSMENLDNGLYRFAGYNQFTFWCMIILRKVFAKSFSHAQYWEQEITTRQIIMSMYFL